MQLPVNAFKILYFTNRELRKLFHSRKLRLHIIKYLLLQNFDFLCRYANEASQSKDKKIREDIVANYTYYALLRYVLAYQDKLPDEALSPQERILLLRTDYLLGVIFRICANRHDHIIHSKNKNVSAVHGGKGGCKREGLPVYSR